MQVYVGGSARWRDLEAWPPQEGIEAWYLNGDGGLSRETHGRHRGIVVPVQPRGPDTLGRRPVAVPGSRTAGQPRGGGTARRAGVHQPAAAGPAGRARPGPRDPAPAGQHAATLTSSSGYATSIQRTVTERHGWHSPARDRHRNRHRGDEFHRLPIRSSGTGCGCRSAGALSRGSPATPAPGNRWPRPPAWSRPTSWSTTTRPGRRRCYYPRRSVSRLRRESRRRRPPA